MRTHQPCPDCGSRDNLTEFDEGNTYCHGCQAARPAPKGERVVTGEEEGSTRSQGGQSLYFDLEIQPLPARKISQETCKKFGYGVVQTEHGKLQVAPYHDASGRVVAQKIRNRKKKMTIRGKFPNTLWGMHLWKPHPNLSITITEGEIDALSVYEVQGDWPVVSIPSGAGNAAKAVSAHLDWLTQFKEVRICFDMDEPGRAAAEEVARILPPGKAAIVQLDGKDANDMLVNGKRTDLAKALRFAPPYRPSGVIHCADESVWERLKAGVGRPFAEYPWPIVNEKLGGLRPGKLVIWTAGSGSGKSTGVREITKSLTDEGIKVGVIALEESVDETVSYQMGIHLNTHMHIEHDHVTEEQKRAAWEHVSKNLFAYDHWGSLASGELMNLIRHLALGEGCKMIVLDHISLAVSGNETTNERKDIDVLMTNLRTLAEELQVNIQAVCHIKRIDGKPANEGGRISLTDLRGSAAIEQLSDQVIAMERNQQADEGQNVATVRILKNRTTGWKMGVAGHLEFNSETGRLTEVTDFDEGRSEEYDDDEL